MTIFNSKLLVITRGYVWNLSVFFLHPQLGLKKITVSKVSWNKCSNHQYRYYFPSSISISKIQHLDDLSMFEYPSSTKVSVWIINIHLQKNTTISDKINIYRSKLSIFWGVIFFHKSSRPFPKVGRCFCSMSGTDFGDVHLEISEAAQVTSEGFFLVILWPHKNPGGKSRWKLGKWSRYSRFMVSCPYLYPLVSSNIFGNGKSSS